MEVYDIFLEQLPKIDLHGFDRDSARVAVNDFVDEAVQMAYKQIVIIHGIGSGIVKEAVHGALARRKEISSYHVDSRNIGCTVVFMR